MGVQNSDSVVAAEMERVTPLVEGLYERDDTFYGSMEKDSSIERVSARDMRIPLKMRPGGNFGQFDSDGGDLGRGGAPYYDKAVINTINLRFGCEWTKKAEWGTDDTRKAVVNAFNKLVADAMPQFRHDSDALCMQPGTGVLGTVSAVSTALGVDTVTLDSDGFGAMLLRSGQKVNVYDSTLVTNRTAAGSVEITYYDSANKIIKLTPATTGITATDVLVIDGVSGANPTSIYGEPYHNSNASTGTWLGLSRADNPEIRSTGTNAVGPLQLPQVRLTLNKMMNRIGKAEAGRLKMNAWLNPCQLDAYEQLGQLATVINKPPTGTPGLDQYYNPDSMQLAGVPVKQSIHWDMTRISFLTNNFWGRAEMKSPGFYDVGGKKFFEVRGNSGGVATSQLFYIVASWNLFCKNPATAAYIYGLDVPTGY